MLGPRRPCARPRHGSGQLQSNPVRPTRSDRFAKCHRSSSTRSSACLRSGIAKRMLCSPHPPREAVMRSYELVHRSHRGTYAAKAGGGNRTTLAVGRSDSLLSLAHDSHQQNRRTS